jgi:type I restriction enzyme S subunit
MTFQKFKFGDVCLKIGSGATPRGGKDAYHESGEYSLVRSQNILDFTFSRDGLAFINEEQASKLNNVALEERDILLNITGDSVARVCQIPNEILPARVNQHVAIIRPNPTILNPEFLKYYLLNSKFKEYMLMLSSSGATRNAITKGMIEEFEIEAPDLPTQTAIAEILSSLDDKIELNNQINQNLEALAQALFKQWFVDFEFPANLVNPALSGAEGYKSSGGEMVDSELGEIPKGWSICMLSEVTEKITDGAHHSPKSEENGFPMASVKDMTTWDIDLTSCRKISKEDYLKLVQMGCRPKIGDVLIAKDGSFLKHTFVLNEEVDLVLLSSIAILRPNQKINSHILNLFLKEESVKERLQNIVTGAVIQRIVLKDFRSFKIVSIPLEIQEKFNNVVDGIYTKIWANNKEVKLLIRLRDTLLPKLISGELEVSQIENEVYG